MLFENEDLTSSAQQEWENLPPMWQQHVESLRAECQANGVNLDDLTPPPIYVQHLDLIPLVRIMSQHPVLRQLYPFTSMAYLKLSDTPLFEANTGNYLGNTGNYPVIEALSDGNFRVLERQITSPSWKWEVRTLFVGAAQQTIDFVAAEIIRLQTK